VLAALNMILNAITNLTYTLSIGSGGQVTFKKQQSYFTSVTCKSNSLLLIRYPFFIVTVQIQLLLTSYQSWANCAEERKSARFFLLAPQRKFRPTKAQLHSLRFKILAATFNHNFYDWTWDGQSLLDWLL
jgi:hypothetical protein